MKTRAIILKKQNINEYDQLVICYTEEFGKITAIAKSVLKPSSIQAMHLDIFNLVDFELVAGSASWRMPIITGAQAEAVCSNLKSNLNHVAVAYFFAETIDKLFFEYQKDKRLWDFLSSLLVELDSDSDDPKEFLKSKQMEFLNILGYTFNLNDCSFCSALTGGKLVAYSIETKGAICQDCFLGGRQGIVLKGGVWQSPEVIGALFESLAEKKLYSLNFLDFVIR
ncbi:MAG: DNA repair protein RecO [Candidatus Yanofskybacteria bacterium RIFCSPHIGHO2_01_FULL_39_8b]|uniref:DNA repair protein RecO n=1 Tax=Candidatus Yanofskybacteria bacterium RIFCSPHIGHO2_01_FULL_39_8b TaxID=1802659 RepID=A0A1F8EFI3_9BACT|nr:MAG: DNA repair protein RecO [Candidatus Yanofskybacteria bacterium RIFCSPHIGHO2_01_FULL_39_8b]